MTTTLRTFKPSAVQIECALTVFKCMAFVDTIRPIVEGYEKKILAEMKAKPSKQYRGWDGVCEYIAEPKDSWLLTDEDAQIYYRRCNEEREKAGLYVENPEFCPLLVAEHTLVKAKQLLIDEMESITGIDQNGLLCSGLDNYDKYIDLTLKLLAPYVKQSA